MKIIRYTYTKQRYIPPIVEVQVVDEEMMGTVNSIEATGGNMNSGDGSGGNDEIPGGAKSGFDFDDFDIEDY